MNICPKCGEAKIYCGCPKRLRDSLPTDLRAKEIETMTFSDLSDGAKCRTPSFPDGDIFTKDVASDSAKHEWNRCDRCGTETPWNAFSNRGHRVHFCPDIEVLEGATN